MLWVESETSKFLTLVPDRDNARVGKVYFLCINVHVPRHSTFFIFTSKF